MSFTQAFIDGVNGQPMQKLLFYSGTNLQYVCWSPQRSKVTYTRRSDSSLTSIAVATNTATVTTAAAHGLYVGARVTVSGATVDTDLNSTYTVLTVPSTTTYTFTTANVSDATYTDAGLVISTWNPLTTDAVWAIQAFTYDGSNLLTGSYWANGSTGFGLAATSRTSY